jgi:hypothetical protein
VRYARSLVLCLVAAAAIAVLGASSASALPEWGQCYAKAGGKYADSNCTKVAAKGTGKFEWRKSIEVTNKAFEGQNVGSGGVLTTELTTCTGGTDEARRVSNKACEEHGGTPESLGSVSIECEAESNHGEATGTKEVKNVSVIFRGCKLFGAEPCQNAAPGEIIINTLKGTLGYLNKAKKEVGIELEPLAKHGAFAQFTCGSTGQTPIGTVVGVGNEKEGAAYSPEKTGGYDGIISPIVPINAMTKEFTQTYAVNSSFENVPNKFEGKHIELLEDYQYLPEHPENSEKWGKAGETITNANHQVSGEEAEIKG